MTDEERDDDLSFVLDYDVRDESDDYYSAMLRRETADDAPEPYWTTRRILFAIILIVMLLSLLAYDLWGILQPPVVPTPLPIPRGTPMPII
ncbi:MAG: hypothetical protein IT320_25250 [Anaerolineae bacterium]|nr:hypothetical protein [Anaerolineae bacterium]